MSLNHVARYGHTRLSWPPSPPHGGTFRTISNWLLLAGSLFFAPTIRAAPIELQLLPPSMDSKGLFFINGSQVLRHLDFSLGLILSYAHRPLAVHGVLAGDPWCPTSSSLPSDCSNALSEVRELATSNLQLALGLFGYLEAGLNLPLTLWDGEAREEGGQWAQGINAQGVGDLAFNFKGRLLSATDRKVGLSVITTFSIPTGNEKLLLGAGNSVLSPSLVLDREFLEGQIHLALNVGARFGLSSAGAHQLTYGAGVSFRAVPRLLELVSELVGRAYLAGLPDERLPATAAQVVAGCKVYLANSSHLYLAAGRGLRGGGSNYAPSLPDFSFMLGFIFEPAIGDRDGDGLKDDVDHCPNDPEDIDDFEDGDGCPDLDNDKDDVLDHDDQCPNTPEDKDGVEDQDGCPDLDLIDRDGDGITDGLDRCPDDPEDRDNFEDADGCPDLDNDQDRILDIDDLCPDQPESYNRYEDDDGCPDERPKVKITAREIVPLEKIFFETDKAVIQKVSFATLDAVVWALNTHTHILLVEIQGHADERGSTEHNQLLTEDRSQAVLTYLINKGISPHRLIAHGYGESRPLERSSTPQAWSKNRRVEFVIIKRLAPNATTQP